MISYLLFLAFLGAAAAQDKPLACLDSGTCYQGGWNTTSSGTQYATFQGIRYAKAPIGNLRFLPPQPLDDEVVIGTIDVSEESKVMCLQDYYGLMGQEDCLLMNIYVPAKIFNDETDTKYPVMYWIYGGGYVIGDGTFYTYGPQPLMDKEGVILVTVNYRLGPFGFLSLGTFDSAAHGNLGLQDQNLGLQWVQQNIAQFKGDPNMVTIFGESAGSLSVALQVLSPLSKGLFQRAIMESGTVLAPTWHFMSPEEAAFRGTNLALNLGCTSVDEYLECLQSFDAAEIINAGKNDKWMPTLESTFLPERPIDILEKGEVNPVEVILGSNAAEGLLWVTNATDFDGCRADFDTCGPVSIFWLNEWDVTEESSNQAKRLVEYYVGSVDNYDVDHLERIVDLYTDGFVLYGYYKFADYLMKNGVTVYQYLFSYVGHFTNSQGKGMIAADHGDEILYLWNYQDAPISGDDLIVKDIVTQAWTNFAVFGDPTPPGANFSWTPLEDTSNLNLWHISGTTPTMEHFDDIQERVEAWKSILENPF